MAEIVERLSLLNQKIEKIGHALMGSDWIWPPFEISLKKQNRKKDVELCRIGIWRKNKKRRPF